MRSLCLVFIAVVSSVAVAACGDPPESPIRTTSHAPAAKAKTGGSAPSPAASNESSTTQEPAPSTPAASTPAAAPAKPAKTNVCENPTCTVQNGACGCTALDTSGTTVEMDCQDGVCTCFTGDQGTTQFDDQGCKSDGDARTLYSANCECL